MSLTSAVTFLLNQFERSTASPELSKLARTELQNLAPVVSAPASATAAAVSAPASVTAPKASPAPVAGHTSTPVSAAADAVIRHAESVEPHKTPEVKSSEVPADVVAEIMKQQGRGKPEPSAPTPAAPPAAPVTPTN